MKKIILSMGIVISGMAMAQYDGRVGITTTTPMATLDIKANGASKLNGILIPRVTKAQAEAMGIGTGTNKLQESTMAYISDATAGATTKYTSKVDAKGFYYFDGTEWVKVGGGASATGGVAFLGPVKGNIRTVANILSSEWTATDFTVMVSDGSVNIQLPEPTKNTGRIISVRNLTSTGKSFTANSPINNTTIGGNRGMLLQSNGTSWYVIASF